MDECHPVTVTGDDGEPVTAIVHGGAAVAWTEADLDAFGEIVRAAQRKYHAEHRPEGSAMTVPEPAGPPDLTEWYAGWRKGYVSSTQHTHAIGPTAAAARVRLADANDHMSRRDMWSAGHFAGMAAGHRATSERLDGASEETDHG